LAGVTAAVVAWPFTLFFLPNADMSLFSPMSHADIASHFCLGTFYGWFRNILFGWLAGLFIVYAYTMGRTRPERVKAMAVSAFLGAVLVTLGHAFKDWLSITLLTNQGTMGPHLLILLAIECLMEPMGLCIAIVCGMGLRKGMLARLPLAILMAWVAATVVVHVASTVLVLMLVPVLMSSHGPINPWAVSAPAFLAEHIAIGAAVGACLALSDVILRPAWLYLALARGEGYSWSLDLPISRIGSAEGLEVRLHDAPGLAPAHAQIQRYESFYALQDLGGGVLLNRYPVMSAWLADGDLVSVGPYEFVFRLRRPQPRRSVDMPPGAIVEGPKDEPEAVPVAAAWRLIDEFGNSYPLSGDSASIGRDAGCDVSLHWESTVSRRHAELASGPTGLVLRDAGSSNGTRLNGSPGKRRPCGWSTGRSSRSRKTCCNGSPRLDGRQRPKRRAMPPRHPGRCR